MVFAQTTPGAEPGRVLVVFGLLALGTLCGLIGCIMALVARPARPSGSIGLGLVSLVAGFVFIGNLWAVNGNDTLEHVGDCPILVLFVGLPITLGAVAVLVTSFRSRRESPSG